MEACQDVFHDTEQSIGKEVHRFLSEAVQDRATFDELLQRFPGLLRIADRTGLGDKWV